MFFSRGPNKIQDLHGIPDMYEFYIENVKGNELYKIEYSIYKEIINKYYKRLMEELYSGYEFHLPYRFGYIGIIKRKVNVHTLTRFGINWVESVKNKKVIYYLNQHSKNYIYRFMWYKENTVIPNLYFYKFVASRDNKRHLAKLIKNRECDFFEKN